MNGFFKLPLEELFQVHGFFDRFAIDLIGMNEVEAVTKSAAVSSPVASPIALV